MTAKQIPGGVQRTPSPIEYSEYPKWLSHGSFSPVIVYNSDQEEQYSARGYFAPQAPNAAESYLVAKATEKLDDAIRTMNKTIEAKIETGLRNLYTRVVTLVQKEIASHRKDLGDLNVAEISSIETTFSEASKSLTVDAMEEIRKLVVGTRNY